MNTNPFAQEYNDLRWGTLMPVWVKVGAEVVQVRARGTCSVSVVDPSKAAGEVENPEDLEEYLRSQAAAVVTDVIGERARQVPDVLHLTTISPETVQLFQEKLDARCCAFGLKLKSVRIEALERV